MKNSQPSLYGSKHLLTLQTLSHFYCFYKLHHSKVSPFKIIISNYIILLLLFCLTFKSLEKYIPVEFNSIIYSSAIISLINLNCVKDMMWQESVLVGEAESQHCPPPIPYPVCCALNALPQPGEPAQEIWRSISLALNGDFHSHSQCTGCKCATFWICCNHITQDILIHLISFISHAQWVCMYAFYTAMPWYMHTHIKQGRHTLHLSSFLPITEL